MIALVATNSSDVLVKDVELFGALQKFRDPRKWNADTLGLMRVNVRTALDERLFNTMDYVDIIYNLTTGSEICARTIRVVSEQPENRIVRVNVVEKTMGGGTIRRPLAFKNREGFKSDVLELQFFEDPIIIGKNTSFLIEDVLPKESLHFYFYEDKPMDIPSPTFTVINSSYNPGEQQSL